MAFEVDLQKNMASFVASTAILGSNLLFLCQRAKYIEEMRVNTFCWLCMFHSLPFLTGHRTLSHSTCECVSVMLFSGLVASAMHQPTKLKSLRCSLQKEMHLQQTAVLDTVGIVCVWECSGRLMQVLRQVV